MAEIKTKKTEIIVGRTAFSHQMEFEMKFGSRKREQVITGYSEVNLEDSFIDFVEKYSKFILEGISPAIPKAQIEEKMPKEQQEFQDKLDLLLDNFGNFLKEKNLRYGNSALQPLKIFSKTHLTTGDHTDFGIRSRIDDKLNRIKNTPEFRKNDLVDLIGYLFILMIKFDFLNFSELID